MKEKVKRTPKAKKSPYTKSWDGWVVVNGRLKPVTVYETPGSLLGAVIVGRGEPFSTRRGLLHTSSGQVSKSAQAAVQGYATNSRFLIDMWKADITFKEGQIRKEEAVLEKLDKQLKKLQEQ